MLGPAFAGNRQWCAKLVVKEEVYDHESQNPV